MGVAMRRCRASFRIKITRLQHLNLKRFGYNIEEVFVVCFLRLKKMIGEI